MCGEQMLPSHCVHAVTVSLGEGVAKLGEEGVAEVVCVA